MIDGEYKEERPTRMAAVRSYRSSFDLVLLRFRGFVVVLLVVDLFAVFVFFLVGLLLLLLGQRAAVGGALVVHLLGDIGLVLIGPGRFAGSHLAAAQAFSGALLLVGFPVVDFVRRHGISVVLFVIDLTARGVLLAIDLLTLRTRELATVRFTIIVHLLVDVRLRLLSAGCFAGS